MPKRLGGIDDVDPLTVPLPPGTEVTTRVDRVAGDRTVPQGAIGRVAAFDGEWVEVEVVGVGRLRYLRAEVMPRKQGLLRYAQRREGAWEKLSPCIVVDVVVGSRAWGLDDESSDEDRRGIFVLPFPWTTGLVDPPGDLASADGSRAYWEIGKAIRQAVRADPNTLEMLHAAGASAILDPIAAELIAARDAFVSLEIYGSFGRYALSQLERLEHNQRLADHRALVLDWLRAAPASTLDEVATRLADAARVAAPSREDAVMRARDYVKQLYRSMYDQGLLPAREWSALVEFARTEAAHFELPRDLRPKNAYNLIRLLDLAIRWLGGASTPSLRVPDELRGTLLAIKHGEVPTDDVLAMARAMTPRLEEARAHSQLPRRADLARADQVLRRVRIEAARRHVDAVLGPLGRDAAAPPVAAFEEDP